MYLIDFFYIKTTAYILYSEYIFFLSFILSVNIFKYFNYICLNVAGVVMASIEYMVELANVLNKDIWLSIPSAASKNYIEQMAKYVKENLANPNCTIYLEQSSDKNFGKSNRTLELNLVKFWKSANDSRVKNVISTSFRAFFNNPPQYALVDYTHFDYFSVSGGIASGLEFISQGYNVSNSANYTTDDVLDKIQQQIYKDEIDLIYLIQMVAMVVKKPLIAYDVGFRGKFIFGLLII